MALFVDARDNLPRTSENRLRRLSLGELKQILCAVDPAAVLVPSRIIRRVIKEQVSLPGLGLHVPHRQCYVVQRAPLLDVVDPLELESDAPLFETVILLAQPDPDELDELPAEDLLRRYWRLLFHSRVHTAIEERLAAGQIAPAMLRQWVHRIGRGPLEEARAVLEQEGLLLPPRTDSSALVEFAAVYLELRYFVPGFVAHYFPALEDNQAVEGVLAEAVDAESLFWATRPRGAPKPAHRAAPDDRELVPFDPEAQFLQPPVAPRAVSEKRYQRLARRAEQATLRGNAVRACLRWTQARQAAPDRFLARTRSAAKASLDALVRRLQAALEVGDEDQAWHEPLSALVGYAARGIWTAEGRLLYDLQKVCVDYERNVFTVDLVEWALSLGTRPIHRPLPHQRDVLMYRHLQSAFRRLTVVRLCDNHRQLLHTLLRNALERVELRLRERFAPVIGAVLEQVGLRPANLPERVAWKKIADELVDRILHRGFLTMGDLRDALARNNLKLPDLWRLSELVQGDPLLQADLRLSAALDGVHRRGEFYLRWMQQLSALAFGTRLGRFVTRYVAVPYGGAYLAIAGLQHLISLFSGVKVQAESPAAILSLGSLLLALVNIEGFRLRAWQAIKSGYRTTKDVVVDLPRRLLQWPWVRYVLANRWCRLGYRFLLKPTVFTALICAALETGTRHWTARPTNVALIFVGVNLVFNTRLGRHVEEIVADWAALVWQRLGIQVFARLFWLVTDLFRGALEAVERALYAVDEWLRFKSGESRATLAAKAGLGLGWFFIAYVIRFCVNLLIEPQINPIKHFPVVTVSHKLLLPFIPSLGRVLDLTLEKGFAYTLAGTIIAATPGIFGFLVWELKENWRLYAANRPGRLRPIGMGKHGETMSRLLRPGFRSGTVPKRFARLRRAESTAWEGGHWASVRKHLHALRGVENAIRSHVERELLGLLDQCECWQTRPVTVGRILLATNRIRIELRCAGVSDESLWIELEVRSDWLVADVADPGWSRRLSGVQRQILTNAIIGLYKLAGVDLVRRQVEERLPTSGTAWDVDAGGLVVWPDPSFEIQAHYDLDNGQWIEPRTADGSFCLGLPVLDREQVVFAEFRVSWDGWVAAWEHSQNAGGVELEPLAPVRVLPG